MHVRLEGLGKTYGDRVALTDLSLDIPAGRVVALLGPNGCGKTTAMGLVLDHLSGRGRTLFDGRLLRSYDRPASVVGAAMAAPAFHPRRAARRHLQMLAAGAGLPRSRVEWVLDEVGLADAAGARPRSFSTGMKQRLTLASALLARPALLVLDEPLNGLDVTSVAWLTGYLRGFRDRGGSVLVSSHAFAPIEDLVDHVVILNRGRQVGSGTVDELRRARGVDSVRTRCAPDALGELVGALAASGLTCTVADDGSLVVEDASTDAVARVAYARGILLTDLTQLRTSLGDVVLSYAQDH